MASKKTYKKKYKKYKVKYKKYKDKYKSQRSKKREWRSKAQGFEQDLADYQAAWNQTKWDDREKAWKEELMRDYVKRGDYDTAMQQQQQQFQQAQTDLADTILQRDEARTQYGTASGELSAAQGQLGEARGQLGEARTQLGGQAAQIQDFQSRIADFNAANAVAQGFTIINNTTVEWNGSNATGTGNNHPVYYLSNPSGIDFIEDEKYRLTLIISNYTGTGSSIGIAHNAGVSGSARRPSNGKYTEDFTSDGETPDIFARITNSATIQVSIKRILPGDIFGFTRLEANNLQKVGIVTDLSNNTITVDSSGVIPSKKDYVLFVKNQVVNKTSLKGYYANVKFENNSKRDAEIFSVGSEITESSK